MIHQRKTSPFLVRGLALAIHLTGRYPAFAAKYPHIDPFAISADIIRLFGEYFQMQDDFLDFAGVHAPGQWSKSIGTDITEGKCSWCIITALEHATPEQRKILDENYGRGKEAVEAKQRVMGVFEEVGLREKFRAYEEEVVRELNQMVQNIPEELEREGLLKKELFTNLIEKLRGRKV